MRLLCSSGYYQVEKVVAMVDTIKAFFFLFSTVAEGIDPFDFILSSGTGLPNEIGKKVHTVIFFFFCQE